MNHAVDYRVDTADWPQIAAHLARCEADFIPPLAGRVVLDDYARKIAANAVRFEAWAGDELAGLVAMYRDDAARSGFVTSVSVLRERGGEGIATALLSRCIGHAAASGLHVLRLEVARDNVAAMRLYRAFGFLGGDADASQLTLTLPLHDGKTNERP